MELFIAGILVGSHATRKRHIRQAKKIQTSIIGRWNRDNPWTWKLKHIQWFMHRTGVHRKAQTQYSYYLTLKIIETRLNKSWTKRLSINQAKSMLNATSKTQ